MKKWRYGKPTTMQRLAYEMWCNNERQAYTQENKNVTKTKTR